MKIEKLCEEIKKGKVVFFVGAGVSANSPSNLPIASEMVDRICMAIALKANVSKYRLHQFISLVKNIRFEVFFEELYFEIGNSAFEVFDIFKRGIPNPIHKFLSHALSLGNNVVTTNFDVLIEQSCKNKFQCNVIQKEKDFIYASSSTVPLDGYLFKLHGSLPLYGEIVSDELLASIRQVGRGLSHGKSLIIDRLLSEKMFIFLGYSGRDEFDIVPKFKNVPSIKRLHWVIHSSPGCELDQYVVELLKNIKGPSDYLHYDTFDFVAKLAQETGAAGFPLVRSPRISIDDDVFCNWANTHSFSPYLMMGGILDLAQQSHEADWFYHAILQASDAPIEVKTRSIIRLGINSRKRGKLDEAKRWADKSLTLAKESNNSVLIARAFNSLGVVARKQAKWSEAIKYYRAGIGLLEETSGHDVEDIAIMLEHNMAIALEKIGEREKALKHYQHIFSIEKGNGNVPGIALTLNNMGISYDNKQEYSKAIECYNESIRLKKLVGDSYGLGQTYHNIGLVQEHLNRLTKAIYWYDRSLKIKEKFSKDIHGIAQSKLNKARVLIHLNKNDIAETLTQEALVDLKRLRKDSDRSELGKAYENLSMIKQKSGEKKEVSKNLRLALNYYKIIGSEYDISRCQKLLGEIFGMY
jgi:tetratricopeptide (TPR) repeat protein